MSCGILNCTVNFLLSHNEFQLKLLEGNLLKSCKVKFYYQAKMGFTTQCLAHIIPKQYTRNYLLCHHVLLRLSVFNS